MEYIQFSSKNGSTLQIPFTGSPLKMLTIRSRFQVEFVKSENKQMNLIIPDGCEGTLSFDRLGSYLYIRLQEVNDEKLAAGLILQISDSRLDRLVLDNGARMKVAGTLGLSQVSIWRGSELDLTQAVVQVDKMELELKEQSKCHLHVLLAQSARFTQEESSSIIADEVHCDGALYLMSKGCNHTRLAGFVGQYITRLFGECEVDASGLHTSMCIAYVMNKSRLYCHVQELHCCHSAHAIVQNSHPQARDLPILNQISFHMLREVTPEDAMQLLFHLKPRDDDHPRSIGFYRTVDLANDFCRQYEVFYKTMEDLTPVIVHSLRFDGHDWDVPNSYAEMQDHIQQIFAMSEHLMADFSDEDVDWEKIPEVQARIRCAIPRRFECLDE